jgi:hypothetical protein
MHAVLALSDAVRRTIRQQLESRQARRLHATITYRENRRVRHSFSHLLTPPWWEQVPLRDSLKL